MNVIKRSGEEVIFDASKIENAIKKARTLLINKRMFHHHLNSHSKVYLIQPHTLLEVHL